MCTARNHNEKETSFDDFADFSISKPLTISNMRLLFNKLKIS